MTKEEALKTYYGYDVFRGGQEAVIDALLSGRDASSFSIMPWAFFNHSSANITFLFFKKLINLF